MIDKKDFLKGQFYGVSIMYLIIGTLLGVNTSPDTRGIIMWFYALASISPLFVAGFMVKEYSQKCKRNGTKI